MLHKKLENKLDVRASGRADARLLAELEKRIAEERDPAKLAELKAELAALDADRAETKSAEVK